MDIFTKQKFTNILIIVLVIVNIGSLTFIWFRESNHPKMPLPPPDSENVNRFLDKELELNADQEKKFNVYRKEHAETTRKFQDKTGRFRREILAESFNEKPLFPHRII